MRREFIAFAIPMAVLSAAAFGQQAPVQNLAGEWRFALDREDAGVQQGWFNKELTDKIKLPGSLQMQGFGDDVSTETKWVAALPRSDPDDPGAPFTLKRWYKLDQYKPYTVPGNIKVPYLSQPVKHYLGVAWYQRDIEIPAGWQNKVEHLFLERPRWGITVYVDDKEVGKTRSLVAPHEFKLGTLSPGKHRLSIRADNRMTVFPGPPGRNNSPGYRPDGHAVSDALGQTWNGIVGRIELKATSPVYIDDAQVFPNVEKKSALIKVKIGNAAGQAGSGTLTVNGRSQNVQWEAAGGQGEIEVPLGGADGGGAALWDEFHPNLHSLTVQLAGANGAAGDSRSVTFGLREVKANGRQMLLNGKEINIRSTHSGGDFPLTGYPATDVDGWKKIIQTCKDYGLNGIRFHSWCPPEAAFTAADELGFYLQPECGMWNNFSNPGMPEMLEQETALMMRAYGNHPSYLLLSPSNEPAGNYQAVLPAWAGRWYEADPRRLYAEDTGRAQPNAQGPTYGIGVIRGNGGWFGKDYARLVQAWPVPVVGHEVGQWCAYPDFDLIKKFTGYLRPGNYEIYRDSAVAKGVIDRNKEFAWASGRFQVKCYKEEIEANLRTPELAGFQLLDLHDYIGQGGALIGVLDPFWESKGYVTPEEWRQFCSPVVPLARLTKYIFQPSETFTVPLEIANYGEGPIAGAAPYWRVVDSAGKTVKEARLDRREIPIGKSLSLGEAAVDLKTLAAPMQYRLEVGLEGGKAVNNWTFWLYPDQIDRTPGDVLVTNVWKDAAEKLAAGGKVLYTPGPTDLGRNSPQMKGVPVFWNRLMNPKAEGDAMLGLWVDAKHPALEQFPTEGFSDWQWISMVTNVKSVNVNDAPKGLRPIVSAIDDWSRNDRLGVVFECRVGSGKLLVSAVDILNPKNVPAQQLGKSLLSYMGGTRFNPTTELTAAEAAALWPGPNAAPSLPPSTQPGANPGDIIEGTPTAPPAAPGGRRGGRGGARGGGQ
jgi:hypothetical protein